MVLDFLIYEFCIDFSESEHGAVSSLRKAFNASVMSETEIRLTLFANTHEFKNSSSKHENTKNSLDSYDNNNNM